ncbi:hypothetical protein [Mangrovicoccus algicola]|uniref:Uncharacterized protein n=1 Tax=Mangrovicoccus algicola TaxID=2771008 RepID=A0A8J6YYQ2_9RHOB|nr:hypothetical protein [Mangrovicoccus algicola]MBE3639064.1 hypothetical protein [Mangrovicoccus algicola]
MTRLHVETLQGFTLPEDLPLRRDYNFPEAERSALYLERYDRRTLFYDAVRLPGSGHLLLTAPPLYNLRARLRRGLHDGGRPVGRGLRHWQTPQAELMTLRRRVQAPELVLDGTRHPLPVRESRAEMFAGLNCMVVLNRDNDPDWIAASVDYHIRAHGLQGVLIFDNGSVTYTAEALAGRLAAVPGLEALAVYRVPFSFGPPLKSRKDRTNPRFLQPALLNLARREILSRARAVLNVDPDEIIRSKGGASVFDRAVARRHTMVKIHGSWVLPPPGTPLPAPQSAHTHREVPNQRCNQKWCAVPGGMLGRFGWAVHHVGGRFVRLVGATPDLELLHCRGTSTGWKSKRFELPAATREDPALAEFFRRWFPND